jgi:hypothetical protein
MAMYLKVKPVTPLSGKHLSETFGTGETNVYDCNHPLKESPFYSHGIVFSQNVHVDGTGYIGEHSCRLYVHKTSERAISNQTELAKNRLASRTPRSLALCPRQAVQVIGDNYSNFLLSKIRFVFRSERGIVP